MGILGSIKHAIFGDKAPWEREEKSAAARPAPAPAAQTPAMPQMQAPAAAPQAQPPAQPAAPVDVAAVLSQRLAAKGNPDLDWQSSIVDLMKLLDIDSSLDNRKELATELGYAGAKDGSAEMNLWLHKAVMKELAKHGGKVPAGLAD